jgi:hypothetical protein
LLGALPASAKFSLIPRYKKLAVRQLMERWLRTHPRASRSIAPVQRQESRIQPPLLLRYSVYNRVSRGDEYNIVPIRPKKSRSTGGTDKQRREASSSCTRFAHSSPGRCLEPVGNVSKNSGKRLPDSFTNAEFHMYSWATVIKKQNDDTFRQFCYVVLPFSSLSTADVDLFSFLLVL